MAGEASGHADQRADRASRLDLIGLDVSGRRGGARRWIGWPLVLAGLVLALAVAWLRVDLIRMRYALADGLAAEQELLEEQRRLTAEMRALRDPSGLAERARELGFVHPERVIDLPLDAAPAPGDEASETALALGATQP